ncbi:hypothetical protein Sjap_022828 [Stephania japonica]|uniref:C2 domain-containing protein n=1 Tax=Stephania japonica TaxID=461633 RepID=A0AAP0EQ46_9MAGN
MSVSGIQGHLLEVTVVGCNKLKDTEWISRQDPYVCLEYGSTKFRTRTCTDGGKNPTFQEKLVFTLIEGLREINVVVWNSNTLTYDDFIGNGKVQLLKVLSQGFDDTAWPLQTKTGRYAGEVRLILHYSNAINKPVSTSMGHVVQPYVASAAAPPVGFYGGPPLVAYTAAHTPAPYPSPWYVSPPPTTYPPTPPPQLQPQQLGGYPPQSYPPHPYLPQSAGYPPQPYPPPPPLQPSSYHAAAESPQQWRQRQSESLITITIRGLLGTIDGV